MQIKLISISKVVYQETEEKDNSEMAWLLILASIECIIYISFFVRNQ